MMKNCFKYYQQYKDQFQCERGKTKHAAQANILVCLEKALDEGNTNILLFDDITFKTIGVSVDSVKSYVTCNLSRDLFQLKLHFDVQCTIPVTI